MGPAAGQLLHAMTMQGVMGKYGEHSPGGGKIHRLPYYMTPLVRVYSIHDSQSADPKSSWGYPAVQCFLSEIAGLHDFRTQTYTSSQSEPCLTYWSSYDTMTPSLLTDRLLTLHYRNPPIITLTLHHHPNPCGKKALLVLTWPPARHTWLLHLISAHPHR